MRPLPHTGQLSHPSGQRFLLRRVRHCLCGPAHTGALCYLFYRPLLHGQLPNPSVPACTPGWLALTATCARLQAAAVFSTWPEGLARPTKAHSDPSVLQTIVVDLQASALRLTYRNPVVEQRYQKWYAEQVARVSRGVTSCLASEPPCPYL